MQIDTLNKDIKGINEHLKESDERINEDQKELQNALVTVKAVQDGLNNLQRASQGLGEGPDHLNQYKQWHC